MAASLNTRVVTRSFDLLAGCGSTAVASGELAPGVAKRQYTTAQIASRKIADPLADLPPSSKALKESKEGELF